MRSSRPRSAASPTTTNAAAPPPSPAPSARASTTRPSATPSTSSPTPRAAASPATCRNGRRPSPPTTAGPPSTSTAPTAAAPTGISALTLRLPQDELLLVGRDVEARSAFDCTLARALLWALAAITALSLATGWLLSRLVSGRIGEIDGAARAIMAGALDRRVALRGTRDEFDRLAGTLNAMLDRIETLVRDLRTVTDSLAHDLRSPLGRLIRHLEAAANDDVPPDEQKTRIEQALREAEGVLATATALLDISRIDAGIGAEQFTQVDLGRLAADVAELYEAAAEERGLRIACEGAPGLVVQGHDQLLALALSNLVENALRHAPAGSEITVAAPRRRRPRPRRRRPRPRHPRGRPPPRPRRFVRLDPSRGGPGAGLGLALVAAVARMHGATIDLGDNAPGLRARLRFAAGPALPVPSRPVRD